jgi:Flp pilus assembly pilin Flp
MPIKDADWDCGAYMKHKNFIADLLKEDSGQDVLEYSLVLAVVLAGVVTGSNAVATVLGSGLATLSGKIQTVLQQA